MMGYAYGWIIMLIGGLIVTGIIVLIVYALVHVISVSGKAADAAPHQMSIDNTSRALSILAERYAKGEISDEEYKQKKSEITRV